MPVYGFKLAPSACSLQCRYDNHAWIDRPGSLICEQALVLSPALEADMSDIKLRDTIFVPEETFIYRQLTAHTPGLSDAQYGCLMYPHWGT